MSNPTRLLIISYWFPPAGGIAVQRALSLARYLPQHGIEVHVLTPTNPPSPVLDPTLLAHVPANVQVHRAFTPTPSAKLRRRIWGFIARSKGKSNSNATSAQSTSAKRSGGSGLSNMVRRMLTPDPEVVWVPFAKRRARQIVRKHAIDTVLVTAPPFSAFLVGNALKREFPNLRLVSDFRDEWLRFFLSTFDFGKSESIRRQAERIERETVELSDAVVTVTAPLVDEYRARYSDQPAAKFALISNGYDPALFADFQPRKHEGPKRLVTYVGTVYSTTTPACYFQALDAMDSALRERIETRIVGRVADDQRALLERPDVTLVGYVAQSEALRRMEETDYLLLIMTDPTFATGKIYEYLATGKPIIAFSAPGSEVARLMADTGAGWCLDPQDLNGNAKFLARVAQGDPSLRFTPNWDAIRRYERPRLAEAFAEIIAPERAAGKSSSSSQTASPALTSR